jgi:hypothetical protein
VFFAAGSSNSAEGGTDLSALVNELKTEHKALFRLLDQVAELGIDSTAGRECLMAARGLFLSHLRKEDEQLHAVMADEAKRDPELRETMSLMNFNLRDVTQWVEDFFAKYSNDVKADTFPGDFELISVLLRNRMRREDKVLFREFDKISGGS